MSFSAEDARHMARALRLAERGLYSTRPNPAVGCVIVHDGEIVGEGWHQRAGGPHAEVIALQQAGERARDATVYVTLEPCSHWGKTPPCAHALVDAGVVRVVIAMVDPNPDVQGQGAMWLRSHGIRVEMGLMTDEAMSLNCGFIKTMVDGLPWVRMKVATSLDGKMAAADGSSQWITGEAARRMGHRLRARSGALITGIGTVLADDPALNVRLPKAEMDRLGLDEALCHPLRVVLDTQLRMPQDARMLTLPGKTLIITSEQALAERKVHAAVLQALGAEVRPMVSAMGEPVALQPLLRLLAESYQVRDALIEAGPRLSSAALEAGVVDELHWFEANCVLGSEGRDALFLPKLRTIDDKICFTAVEQRTVGPDRWRVLQRSGH